MQIIRVRLTNANGKTKGCEKAPVEILNALKTIGSNENGKLIEFEKLNLEEIHVDLENLEEANYLIFENSKEAFDRNFKTIFLGGDHCISYPIVKAFLKREQNPLLIIFDSHADCCETTKIANHENWLRKLIEEGLDPEKVILISARDFWESEIKFLEKHKLTWIKMDLLREDLEGICDLVMERAKNSSGFYISLDIDSVDPGFAPGTGYLEPGGISSRDLIYFIKRLNLLKNFKGIDIVEINPEKDVHGMTVKLGARIVAELI